MQQIHLKALAKINLGLDVLGRQEDGYHQIQTVMQSVYLYDDVEIEKDQSPGVSLSTNLYFLPTGESNLAYQAAEQFLQEFGIEGGVQITLQKHIPVSAGLAGGSSDAAAVLFGMNRLFDTKLSTGKLMEIGARLGSDVPYCIMRGTALAEGVGERLTRLPALPPCTVLIAKPSVNVSTRMIYQALDEKPIGEHPDMAGLLDGLEKEDLGKVAGCMGNVLEEVTIPMFPVIKEIKQEMIAGGALNALMSGSGPTVFGLFEERKKAETVRDAIREKDLARQVYVTNAQSVRRKK